MCGHFGLFGVVNQRLLNVFEDGLSLDQIRGPHSTGVAFIENKKRRVTTIKDTVLPHKLFRKKEWAQAMSGQLAGAIGHNRWATAGKVTKDNAHPFTHGHITLAHNGTISNWDRKHLPEFKRFEVDSDNICFAISTLGIEAAWKLIDGPATIVFYDAKENSLNIISNGMRPFHYSWVNNANAVVWCSDENILKAALERNDVETSTKEDSFTLVKDQLYSFSTTAKGGLQYTTQKLEPFRAFLPARSVGKKFRHIDGIMVEIDDDGKPIENQTSQQRNNRGGDVSSGGPHAGLGGDRTALNAWLEEKGNAFPMDGTDDACDSCLVSPEDGGVVMGPDRSNVHQFPDKGKVSGSKEQPNGITRGGYTAEGFKQQFGSCVFCDGHLDYMKCTVIDDDSAACVDCSEVAARSSVPIQGKRL